MATLGADLSSRALGFPGLDGHSLCTPLDGLLGLWGARDAQHEVVQVRSHTTGSGLEWSLVVAVVDRLVQRGLGLAHDWCYPTCSRCKWFGDHFDVEFTALSSRSKR